IEPVSVPRHADIPQLVFTSADGVSQLNEHHRWRAPLSDEIAGALSQRLQAHHGVSDVGRIAVPEGMPVMRLRVDVQRFEALPGSGEVLVSAVWSLRHADSRHAALQCAAQIRRPVEAADPDALVRAYRTALEALGDQIGRALQDVFAPAVSRAGPPMCPPAA
ncbi:MAG: PqiC family protein, partial [Panacagrimonas sp.]